MNKTTHTPGPWAVIPAAREGHAHKIREPGGHVFASIGARNDWNEQCANAALIASAPGLLEACILLLECADAQSGLRATAPCSWNAAQREARAAIAKAEGST